MALSHDEEAEFRFAALGKAGEKTGPGGRISKAGFPMIWPASDAASMMCSKRPARRHAVDKGPF